MFVYLEVGMEIRWKALRPVLAVSLGMGLAASLAAGEGDPGFKWLGLRAGTLFFDPPENAGSAVFLGAQGGMVFEGRRHGFTFDGFQYTTKSSLAPGVNLNHRGASATFLSGLSEDPGSPLWPYMGLGLGTFSVPEVDPLTLAQTSTRTTTAHVSLGFVQRPGGGFIWGMEGRAVSRLPIKALQEIQVTFLLGYIWGGRSSTPLADVSSTPPPPMAPPDVTALPSAGTPSAQSPAPPTASARPVPSPTPTAVPAPTPIPAAPAPAALAPVIVASAPTMPELAPVMTGAPSAEPAPPTAPTPSVQSPAPAGVMARPMAPPPSTAIPLPIPAAPEPASLAPVIVASAPTVPEPAPVMTGAAPAEPAPTDSTATERVEALLRGDIPRALELSRRHIGSLPARHWTIRLEVASLTVTLKNAVRAFPGATPDLFIAPIQLRGGKTANQLFLGDYVSKEEAERAARAVPTYFLKGRQRPIPFLVSDIPAQVCPMARPVPIPPPAPSPAPKGISLRSRPSCTRCH